MNEKEYLNKIKTTLFNQNRIQYELKRDWKTIPSEAGVYIVFENGILCYVGETGSLRGRQRNLIRTVNHTLRITIGDLMFSKEEGYIKDKRRKKFPDHIEEKLNSWMVNNITISFLPVPLGRKELEEMICDEEMPKYNRRGRRMG